MISRFRFVPFVLGLAVLSASAYGQQTAPAGGASGLLEKLKAIPGVVDVRPAGGGGRAARGPVTPARETYDVTIEQPIDHANPAVGKFQQHFFVAHADFTKPIILGTEGYASNGVGSGGELARMLDGPNLVTVEHRYFGRSIPANGSDGKTPWKYLTVKNAADDMHHIVTEMKKIYSGKWVATGASKGGQTSLFYKCYFPDDMNAIVAYVAPVNIGQEDPRINQFMETVGDEATRKKIKDIQIAYFKREDEILPLLNLDPAIHSLGISQAYEYGVLEFPYDFWQNGRNASNIPAPDAPAQTLATHLRSINTIQYYSDPGKKRFEAFQYQAFTEIGYYNYDITDFRQYMKTLKNPTNLDICPPGTKETIVYNPATMAFVFNYLQYKANNVAFIYGETDAWSSTQMHLLGRTNAIKIVVKDAAHSARIGAASAEQKEEFYSNMDKWLDMKLVR